MARLRDKSISVRKSVLRIAEKILSEENNIYDREKYDRIIYNKLAERLSDITEDKHIKEQIQLIFCDNWFHCENISNWEKEPPIAPIIHVVRHNNDLNWLISIIKALPEAKQKVLQVLTSALVMALIKCDEYCDNKDFEAKDIVKTLEIFCIARPSLLLPHVDALAVYLKVDNTSDDKNNDNDPIIIGMILKMLAVILPSKKKIFIDIENDLELLILMGPPSVVAPAVKCLAIVSDDNNLLLGKYITEIPILLKVFYKFYSYLTKYLDKSINYFQLTSAINSNCQRAFFVCGLIAKYFTRLNSFSMIFNGGTNCKKTVVETLYDVYTSVIQSSMSISPKAITGCGQINGINGIIIKAIQGLFFLYIREPKLLLNNHKGDIISSLLSSSNSKIIIHTLNCLIELLEEERLQLERAVDSSIVVKSNNHDTKKLVSGDQNADTCLISGSMQNILALLIETAIHPETIIRRKTITIIQILLTQGIISPAAVLPTLLALKTDNNDRISSNSQIIDTIIMDIIERHPDILQSSVFDGIYNSFRFLSRVVGLQDFKNCYTDIYNNLIGKTRQHRMNFLRSLINVFSSSEDHRFSDDRFKRYVAQLLSTFPYKIEDEPLYIIYLINRYISLDMSSVKERFTKELTKTGIHIPIVDWKDVHLKTKKNIHLIENEKLIKLSSQAISLIILTKLKLFLKRKFNINNEKCILYKPSNIVNDYSGKLTETSEVFEIDLISSDQKKVENLDIYCKIFIELLDVSKIDQDELDFNVVIYDSSIKKLKKRKSYPNTNHTNKSIEINNKKPTRISTRRKTLSNIAKNTKN